MPKPPVKKTRRLAEAEAFGRTVGEKKAERHLQTSNRATPEWFEARFRKAIDRIDPMESLAIITTTLIIRFLIEETETLQQRVLDLFTKPKAAAMAKVQIGEKRNLGFMMPIIWYFIPVPDPLPTPHEAEEGEEQKDPMDTLSFDLFQWIIAFALAYFIVVHGDKLINLIGSITSGFKGAVTALLALG